MGLTLFFLHGAGLIKAQERKDCAEAQPGHPRLFVKAESDGNPRTVTLDIIRKKAQDPRFERFHRHLHGSVVNLAMRALAYDDQSAADSAIAILIAPIKLFGNTTDGELVMWAAMAFDWLYNHPSFDPWEKALAVEQISEGAEQLYEYLHGPEEGNHIFHTRMYGWSTGLAAAGIALTGHYAGASKLLKFATGYYQKDILPARRLQGGSVHNGFGYGRRYTMFLTGHYLSMIYSATGEDLWTEIREHQEDWAAREAEFIIYGRQPDALMAKFGDCYRRTSERYSFRVIAERNWHYREPVLQGYLQMLLDEKTETVFEPGAAYIAYLYYDPDRPTADYRSLPKRTIFGPHGPGMVFWKEGWGRNDTWIFFKCGDYFDNHGHYDQGHVEIFRGDPLLTEAGAYATFSGPYGDFYHGTVPHNTLLVVDPEKPDDVGGQRPFKDQTLGTMKEYLSEIRAESGDIVIYEDKGPVSYLMADLTAGYPGERVQRLTRELVLVKDRFLIIRDRVILANDRYLPKVLWHCPVYPEIGKDSFTVRRGGSRVVIRVLSPENPKLKWVEGSRVGDRILVMPKDVPHSDPCVGRMELVGSTGVLEQEFIQVLDIAAESQAPGRFSLKKDPGGTTISLPGGRKLILQEAGARLR